MRGAVVPLELHRTCFETTSKTPNYCLILYKLFTFGIVQASLTLLSLNRNFQMRCICRICSRSVVKASFIALTYSQILKFITFTLEVKCRLWSASHPETVWQRSLTAKVLERHGIARQSTFAPYFVQTECASYHPETLIQRESLDGGRRIRR